MINILFGHDILFSRISYLPPAIIGLQDKQVFGRTFYFFEKVRAFLDDILTWAAGEGQNII